MKNFFPLILLGVVFTGFLASQIIFDVLTPSANHRSQEKSRFAFYSQEFRNKVFKTTSNDEYSFKKEQTPVVILNFWASWCLPCIEEMPLLVKLQNEFPESRVKLIGINTDEEDQSQKIKKIEKKFKMNFSNVADNNGQLMNLFNIANLPATIIFYKGEVVDYKVGSVKKMIESREMSRLIEEKLKLQNL